MLSIVTYSYLVFPLLFLLLKAKFKDTFVLLLALYGVSLFSLIFFDGWIDKEDKKYYQAFYTMLEYLFFTSFIWLNIRNTKFKKFIAVCSFLFFIFEIFFVTAISFQRLDSIPIAIETILVFIFTFFFFFEFSKHTKEVFIYNVYGFWVAVGMMIYLGGSFFFYILANHLDRSEADKFITMTWIAEIVKNLLFIISVFIYKKFSSNKTRDHLKNIPNLDMI